MLWLTLCIFWNSKFDVVAGVVCGHAIQNNVLYTLWQLNILKHWMGGLGVAT